MPKRVAMSGSSSVLSLARRTFGASRAAACSYAGAIIRHGPHQGAQKSTTNGRSFPATWRSKVARVTSNGCWGRSCSLQRPHFGSSSRRAPGTRLAVAQCAQTTRKVSLPSGRVADAASDSLPVVARESMSRILRSSQGDSRSWTCRRAGRSGGASPLRKLRATACSCASRAATVSRDSRSRLFPTRLTASSARGAGLPGAMPRRRPPASDPAA